MLRARAKYASHEGNSGNLGLSRGQSILLALVYMSGGLVQQFKRLKLSVYGIRNLAGYEFQERCYWGPDDARLREDLDLLRGFLELTVEDNHTTYRLTSYGAIKAHEVIKRLKPDEVKEIERVAGPLRKSPESTPVAELYERYVAGQLK